MSINAEKAKQLEKLKSVVSCEFPKFSNKNINTVFYFYDSIKNVDKAIAPALLQHLCVVYEESAQSHEVDARIVISREEISALENNFDEIIEAKLKTLLRRQYDEKTFYEKLWHFIWKSDALTDIDQGILDSNEVATCEDKVRAYALYEILRDKRVPYYQLDDGLSMSNEDYRFKCEELSEIRRKIRFILSADIFDQKTEKASQIVKLLDSLDDYKDKTVAMVFVIGELQKSSSEISAFKYALQQLKGIQ